MDFITDYLQQIENEYCTGIAAEHAYRAALEALLEAVEDGLNAVNDPKRTDIGAPDFHVLRHGTTIGFVEAKDIGVPLDKVERSEQMRRYLPGFPNLILTDYLEFRWYVKGEHQQTVRIGQAKKHIVADSSQFSELLHLLRSFVQVKVPTIHTAKELAQRMAANAHLIRDLIFNDLQSDSPSPNLIAQRDAFEKTLLPNIDNAQFADMYAQTIAYGLFAARVNFTGKPETFSRRGAGEDIPRTNPFLRKLFINIGLDLGDRVTFLVDVLADLLAHTDVDDVLKDFGRATRQQDPVVHFYETFLAAYDPTLREQRGVYYTPEPVVSYIVRSVDHILREEFGRSEGLADTNTLILDPATGTGTFLYFVIKLIHEAFAGQEGIWSSYVREHLLRRIFGFELLMAPYAIAHMKLGLLLDELGYNFKSDQRLGVYLTNTLEEATKSSEAMFAQFISEEANEAAAVKRDKPIMVVMGNPPYSYSSANNGEWINSLIRDYYRVDGKALGERNPKGLQDDYVKFFRFGQWRIGKTGCGVLAFVTNHGYLSNSTFRGMRQKLMQEFSDIYIIDLHGNSKKKERTPDGSPDDNVFDIQQGVAIGIFVKEEGKTDIASVHHAELWSNDRTHKYEWLSGHDLRNTVWTELSPKEPSYLFTPQDMSLASEFEVHPAVTDMFPVNTSGLNTARDALVIDTSKDQLAARIHDIVDNTDQITVVQDKYKIRNTGWWNFEEAVGELMKTPNWESMIIPCIYRPFDKRWLFFHPAFIDRPRLEINRQILRPNLTLVTTRQTVEPFSALATDLVCGQHKIVAMYDRSYVFPLYLYPKQVEGELFNTDDDGSVWPLSAKGRRPNISPHVVQELTEKLDLQFVTEGKGDLVETFGPEDIFAYVYALFHSPSYRERFSEFLKVDFPRLPLTSDLELFRVLSGFGAKLVDLHLMRSTEFSKLLTTFPEGGSNGVERGYPKYTEANQRVYINKIQYFEGVPPEVWDFHVGGYQVLDKWLKDRRGRELSFEDVKHYQQIVVALAETMRIMQAIDEAIPEWPIT